MAEFPAGVYAPRIKANRAGDVYEPLKSTKNFAEDITKLDDEVVAIEEYLHDLPSGGISFIKIPITSAQILALNTTPIVLVSAPGVGKLVKVLDCFLRYNFVTSEYNTNIDPTVKYTTDGDSSLFDYIGLLSNTESQIRSGGNNMAFNTKLFVNDSVELVSISGDPLDGDSTIDVYIAYQIITL